MLIVLSGLPGSGKSALADKLGRRLGAAVLSVDPIEAAIWRGGVPPSFATGVAAYEVAAMLAEQQLRLGLPVIADAVNSLEVGREMWRSAAHRTGARMFIIEVVCSDPLVHRHRLEGRSRAIDGFPEPTWAEVMVRRAEWEDWTEDRLVLDSLNSFAADLDRAIAYLDD